MSLSSRRTELQWKQPDHARLQHLVCCRFTLSPAVFQNLIFSILFLHWCDFYLQYVSLWQMGMHQKSMPRVVYELGRITLQDIRRYIENHVVLILMICLFLFCYFWGDFLIEGDILSMTRMYYYLCRQTVRFPWELRLHDGQRSRDWTQREIPRHRPGNNWGLSHLSLFSSVGIFPPFEKIRFSFFEKQNAENIFATRSF
jgi:hypothetical protein